ncbi:hypothetical protein K7X08_018203 [Anisodus acutangulus]|uniref:non-specific serine/threonine protein kinase n=1 Tax=Anisodus acutangulus TaxID=402998 RepID=A0A9Q1LZ67_9SOLA|nr:hypothetical protein K7X08_018203 [Anisodus acutangulus]
MLLFESATNLSKPGTSSGKGQGKKSEIELKFFELHDLKTATNNFSPDSKLGEGGFGHVFKGKLSDGQKIAVKSLSTQSRQGLSEFKTEALLIAKLQHRNLVRFLGCCVEVEEKMLIYEYMPNKSLSYFIFDESRKSLLDWKKRHEIIVGINQNEANTLRIVGTYGYMSPEYALAVSYNSDSPPNLIRQAWELWNDGKAFELIDPSIVDSCFGEEELRCIQVGLLCLQVNAVDRLTMSSVLFMLSNEATVPSPKQPSITPNTDSGTTETTPSSINEVTITAPDGS